MIRNRLKQKIPRGMKDWVRFSLLHLEEPSGPILVDKPDARRVAVLSPHPDDEIIGCGGTLHKHRLAGDHVTVIYLTDGACGADEGDPGSMEIVARRRREAKESAKVLGIHDLVFLDGPDGGLTADAQIVERVRAVLAKAGPQCIFLPFFLDNHPDHRATNRILAAVVPLLKKPPEVYAYEVWTPLVPNRLVDITSVAEIKEKAIRKHVSQMRSIDYAETTLALNRFRSRDLACGRGYFEAFLAMDAGSYAGLVDQVLGREPS